MGQAARAVELGTPLSPDERRLVPANEVDPAQARAFYDMRQRVAHAARRELKNALFEGLPRMGPAERLPGGIGYACISGEAGLQHARVTRLVNAYVIACKALDGAANALCDVMDWDEDTAREHGIEWEAPL